MLVHLFSLVGDDGFHNSFIFPQIILEHLSRRESAIELFTGTGDKCCLLFAIKLSAEESLTRPVFPKVARSVADVRSTRRPVCL